MFQLLMNNPELLMVFLSGLSVFLGQFAGILWRISKAESRIHERINDVESDYLLEIEKLKQSLLKARLEISDDYLKRDSFQLVTQNMDAHLVRLEAKLDAIIQSRPYKG